MASWWLTDWATRGSSLQPSPPQGGILNALVLLLSFDFEVQSFDFSLNACVLIQ